ncbi:MAG: Uma2 family endonuclease [Oscillospiraceae bacterium]|nr:Uma2 family endonuclease [Oscillospiraceae bacterium]
MDNLVQMSTTGRHNMILQSFIGTIYDLIRKKEVFARQEQYSIVYWGSKKKPSSSVSLVKIEDVEDVGKFINNTIYELDYVQPDFVLFKDNKYLTDSRDLRTAGQPDLIVEVWSGSNTKTDRDFLGDLYSTSKITEFWQIEQDSNTVKCSMGTIKLPEQSLVNVLKTQKGLEFDLRYLAD